MLSCCRAAEAFWASCARSGLGRRGSEDHPRRVCSRRPRPPCSRTILEADAEDPASGGCRKGSRCRRAKRAPLRLYPRCLPRALRPAWVRSPGGTQRGGSSPVRECRLPNAVGPGGGEGNRALPSARRARTRRACGKAALNGAQRGGEARRLAPHRTASKKASRRSTSSRPERSGRPARSRTRAPGSSSHTTSMSSPSESSSNEERLTTCWAMKEVPQSSPRAPPFTSVTLQRRRRTSTICPGSGITVTIFWTEASRAVGMSLLSIRSHPTSFGESFPALFHGSHDPFHHIVWRLVLPYADDQPAILS
ncbi:MAG: hypothetical protein KatS3mg124_1170 [Porticoccaceae bacterium]|nr:MAG: hypothetical protein KatS3mg124_1170 [Porticoccaceae bacterium]